VGRRGAADEEKRDCDPRGGVHGHAEYVRPDPWKNATWP
jgi:hypothetical protein